MRAHRFINVAAALCASGPLPAKAQPPSQPLPFEQFAATCAPDIHPTTLKALVSTESSWNPYAIGVVGGHLERQPRNLAEAIATAKELLRQGFNFSMGLGQVNRANLAAHGETVETVFEPCRNIKTGGTILKNCYLRAKRTIGDEQSALLAAFSCYYSGSFTRGFRADKAGGPSYVQKVVANAGSKAPSIPIVPAIQPRIADGAVAVRPSGLPAAPTPRAEPPAQWVIFADGPAPVEPPTEQPETQPAPAAQIRLAVPYRRAGPSAGTGLLPQQTQIAPDQSAVPTSGQKDVPFVLFID